MSGLRRRLPFRRAAAMTATYDEYWLATLLLELIHTARTDSPVTEGFSAMSDDQFTVAAHGLKWAVDLDASDDKKDQQRP